MSFPAFYQVTQELPNELKQVIWKLSQRPPSFNEWMDSINTILWNTHEVEVGDLPDQPFVDYHEEGLEPQDVVDIMIEDAFLF
jgi:hypothetical protein